MTVRRAEDVVMIEGVCTVEDAEVLMRELQDGASIVDWSGCTHLHTACLQVILASHRPVRGTPANPILARWLLPILNLGATLQPQIADLEIESSNNYLLEA